MFTDEHEEHSLLGWFFLLSIMVHALFFWLWPQWQASFVSGVGLDEGGIVELVILSGEPSIQPPAPPRPTPPVQERPPRQDQSPEPEPRPEPEVRRVEQQVEPPAPPRPEPPVHQRPTPPEPEPEPISEPEPKPAPEPEQQRPQPERGVGDDILVSEHGQFDIPSAPRPEEDQARTPVPEPETAQVPRTHETESTDTPDEPVAGESDGSPDEDVDAEPAAPPQATFATRFGLGSPKALENVAPGVTLGELQVEIHVRGDGMVERVQAISSSGMAEVDDALIALMERWEFEATGQPYIEVWRVGFEHRVVGGVTEPRPVAEFVERR